MMKSTRRSLLAAAATVGAMLSAPSVAFWRRSQAKPEPPSQGGNPAVSVHEVTMAAPDIICVEVRDPPIKRGHVQTLAAADSGAYGTALTRKNPSTGLSDKCVVVGAGKTTLRFQDVRATTYLGRAAADKAAEYGMIGNRTVIAVHRKSMPYDGGAGTFNFGYFATAATSSKHFLYLKLSGNLGTGNHTISFPAETGLRDHNFNFDDKVTRCSSIKATQHGHRPSDASKLAYLALWIPGAPDEGAIEFASTYGLSTFHIVDDAGVSHFNGTISPRIAPKNVEEGDGGARKALRRYASSTPPIVATGAAQRNPVVITAAGHGLQNGDVVIPYGFQRFLPALGGMYELDQLVDATVANATANTFELAGIDGRSFHAFAGNGLIYRTQLSNRAGTYVYGLDYSAFAPKSRPGEYRVYIPGLGVSDPFLIDDAVWFLSAHCSAKGEYHQRSGIALDGRFGYSRPVSFRSGTDRTIYKNRMPYIFTKYSGYGPLVIEDMNKRTWLTNVEEKAWGGWHDAGDWDSRLHPTASATFMLMDVYEHLPAGSRDFDFGLPKSSAILDAALYAGTDGLSDLLHSAIWNIDFFRRMQEPSGAVSGGMSFNERSNFFEPSWLTREQVSSYLPDHNSTFAYAALAAKLARILQTLGLSALADLYKASALAANTWAENIYSQTAARNAYYLDMKTRAGMTDSAYDAAMVTVQKDAALQRIFAAGCLFSLTGDRTYAVIVEANHDMDPNWVVELGLWEYSNALRVNFAVRRTIRSKIVTRCTTYITGASEGRTAYRTLQFAGTNMRFGGAGPNMQEVGHACIISHLIDRVDNPRRAARHLAALQANMCFVQGANQNGISLTNGLGVRNLKTTLHNDSYFSSQNLPIGITSEGWSEIFFIYALNFGTSPINYIIQPAADPLMNRDFEDKRTLTPSHRRAFPLYEALFENQLVIEHMEYTVQQTILPALYVSAYLHGWDGNSLTRPTTGVGSP